MPTYRITIQGLYAYLLEIVHGKRYFEVQNEWRQNDSVLISGEELAALSEYAERRLNRARELADKASTLVLNPERE